jgi:acyl carrier protein
MATARSESNVAGDMFVFTKEGKLVFTGSGVQFTRLPIAKLEKLLDGISMNPNGKPSAKTALQGNESHGHGLPGLPIANGITHKPSVETLDERTLVDPEILPRGTSFKPAMIKNDEALSTLGLDSISKIEFFNKIQSEIGRETSKDDLSRIGAIYNKFSSAIENKTANIEETEIFSSSPDSAKTAETHSKMRTKQRILEMIADNSGQSTGSIEDETNLQDIGIDSLSVVELKESFENGFGVDFGDWDFGLHLTVSDILEFVESQL